MFGKLPGAPDTTPSKGPTCFICYDRNNPNLDQSIKNLVVRLAGDLRARGVTVHGDTLTNPASWGDDILSTMTMRSKTNHELIQSSNFVILLATKNLNDSKKAHDEYVIEYNYASDLTHYNGLVLLPILCEGSSADLPLMLRGKMAIVCTDFYEISQADKSLSNALKCGPYKDLFVDCIARALRINPQTPEPAPTRGFGN